MSSPICVLVEGAYYSLGTTERYLPLSTVCTDFDKRLVIEALTTMREAIEVHARAIARETARIFGFPIKVIESLPPRIIGNNVHAGFWTGVFEYTSNSKTIRIVVLPRINRYDVMIEEVNRVLGGIAEEFKVLTGILTTSTPGIAIMHLLKLLLLELGILMNQEPKRIRLISKDVFGEALQLRLSGKGLILYPVRTIFYPNTKLYTTIVLASRYIVAALNSLEDLIEELKTSVSEFSQPSSRALLNVIKSYVDSLRTHLSIALEDYEIAHILSQPFLDSIEVYDHVVTAARKLASGVTFTSITAYGHGRQILFPSTKLYELYVYAIAVKQCCKKLNTEPKYLKRLSVEIGDSKLYFNHYPKELSRIITAVTGGKTPNPDALFLRGEKAVVLEAKYRYLDAKKRRLLGLPDAVRIAAYLADAARNKELKAIITALSEPSPEFIEKLRERLAKRSLNGKRFDVVFIEVNPDRRVRDLSELLF